MGTAAVKYINKLYTAAGKPNVIFIKEETCIAKVPF
jgi:hypothetical protein